MGKTFRTHSTGSEEKFLCKEKKILGDGSPVTPHLGPPMDRRANRSPFKKLKREWTANEILGLSREVEMDQVEKRRSYMEDLVVYEHAATGGRKIRGVRRS